MNGARRKEGKFTSMAARILAAVFLLIGILLGVFDYSTSGIAGKFPYRFGLDLRGGTHLLYEADMSGVAAREQESLMGALRDVIEKRINLFGVAEPVVQVEKAGGKWRLIVELAGIKDIDAAIKTIGETPFLEFKEEKSDDEIKKILEEKGKDADRDLFFKATALTGKYVKGAEVRFDRTLNSPYVSLELTDEGAEIFKDLTARNIGKPLAIYLDGELVSAPTVRSEISGGKAVITGKFTPEEARELAGRLNAGALPVPIKLISRQTVGASLGADSLEKGIRAGGYGIAAVGIFMILWYRLPGLISVLALGFYVAAMLAIFKLIPVTLTVSGIAGFILSVGMAVDANVLIFERLKEELQRGRTLRDAVEDGFARAWTSIRDSNITSLLTSLILYWIGTSVVQGFALTLGIGVLISMFSAVWVTRVLLIAVMTKWMQAGRVLFMSGISR